MKLLNRSLLHLSVGFFVIIGIWSVIFYFNLKDEIRDSIDDGLDNNRLLIIQKIYSDATLLEQDNFGGNNFEIHKTKKHNILEHRDLYKDTLMYRQNENDLEPVRILHTAFLYKNEYYKLKVISSLVEEDDLIEDSFWSIVWLFIILIGSVFIINNVILRQVWTPFYDILDRLKTYRLHKDETPIKTATKTSEFIELQNAANALIVHSKDSYNSQKQFTENASHELQTPLAIIANKLELLLDSEHLETKDANSIADVLRITQRLTQLNKSLLLLAKIENKQFDKPELISINKKIKDLVTHFEDYTAFKNVKIDIQSSVNLTAFIDPILADILLSNLIKNAIIHNISSGDIRIKFSKQSITICNTGKDRALQSQTIFNRFQKESNSSQSTGIGLAISKSIADYYNVPLTYQFIENRHCFSIDFKNCSTPA
ncbi:sensor histidine kinase [Lacinutrix undariae]